MPGWKFGIHKAVYKQLLSINDEEGAAEFLLMLGAPPFQSTDVSDPDRRADQSIGPDGMILTGNSDLLKGRLPDPFG